MVRTRLLRGGTTVTAWKVPGILTISQFWGLLQKKVRFETYLLVGTFPRGWYVYMIFHDIYTDFYTVSEVG